MPEDASSLSEFVAARQGALLRFAWLLTGDEESARDLLQEALARAMPKWSRLQREGAPEAYVRRVMINLNISWWRRRVRGRLASVQELSRTRSAAADVAVAVANSVDLARALLSLPPRQRAVIVLRFYEDFTEVQTADALGCSVGTVKSQTSKALTKLRRYIPSQFLDVGYAKETYRGRN